MPVPGFYFSETWVMVNNDGIKKHVCFMLPEKNPDSIHIAGIIKILKTENFPKTLAKKTGF